MCYTEGVRWANRSRRKRRLGIATESSNIERRKYMRRINKTTIWTVSLAACVLAVIAVVRANETKPEPVFSVDTTPIVRDGTGAQSYSSVIKKVRPSIVSVWTSKTVQIQNNFGGGVNPFFDDPMFRRFFGDQGQAQPQTRTPQKQKRTGLGSGVIVTKDGYILTNNHVVEDCDEIKITMHDTDNTYDATIVGKDPSADLAVLKIDASNLPEATLGDSDGVEEGDVVLAFGNPFGVGQTVTMGIVSATDCNPRMDADSTLSYEHFIQTDAAINPGNSGGALVDALGRVIGINTAIYSRTGGYQGIGWAIPVNMAKSTMKQIISNGKVSRGYLGVTIQKLTDELAESFNLKDKAGALVGGVTSGSAAEKAGLKAGDVIIAVNDKPIKDSTALQMTIADTPPGEKVTVKIIRNGETKDVVVTLDERPTQINEDGTVVTGSGSGDTSLTGVTVTELTSDLRKDLQISDKIEGVFVNAVDIDSQAYEKGLRTGDVIQECNGTATTSVSEFKEAVRSSENKTYRLLVYSKANNVTHFVLIKE